MSHHYLCARVDRISAPASWPSHNDATRDIPSKTLSKLKAKAAGSAFRECILAGSFWNVFYKLRNAYLKKSCPFDIGLRGNSIRGKARINQVTLII